MSIFGGTTLVTISILLQLALDACEDPFTPRHNSRGREDAPLVQTYQLAATAKMSRNPMKRKD